MALDPGLTGTSGDSSSSDTSDTQDTDDDTSTLDGGGVSAGTPGEGGRSLDPVSEQERTDTTDNTDDDTAAPSDDDATGSGGSSGGASSGGNLTTSPVATDDPASAGSGGPALDEASQDQRDSLDTDAPGSDTQAGGGGPGTGGSQQDTTASGPGGGISTGNDTMARGGQTGAPSSGRNFADEANQTQDASDLNPEDFDSPEQYVETATERQFDSVDESEIYATRSGDTIEPRFTREGARQAAASRIGVPASQIELDGNADDGYTVGDVRGEVVEQREQLQQRQDVGRELSRGAAVSNVITQREAARDRADQAQTDFSTGRLGDPRDIVRETVAEQAGEDVTPSDVQVRDVGGETEVRITGSPREQVVNQLEEDTAEAGAAIDLSQSDVDFERVETEDGPALRGELDTDAQRRFRQEQAPGQGTPLEGAFEAGAGLQFDYEQSTAGVEETFNENTPDTGFIEETFNENTPDVPSSDDVFGLATAAAPIAVAEPSPVGEIGVAGIAAIGTAIAAGEGLRRLSTSSGAGVAATEVDIPDAEGGQFRNELEITGSSQQFATELGVPDKSEQMAGPFGVPEQGITIDPEQNIAPWETNPDEMPIEGDQLFTTELDVPSEDSGDVTLNTQQVVGEQRQRPGDGGGSSRFRQRRRQREVPEDLIPDRDVVIGEETPSVGGGFPSVPARDSPGLQQGSRSGVQFIGRRPRPGRTLERARDSFFSVELTQPFEADEVRESAESRNVDAGTRPTPTTASGVDPLTGTRSPVDTASDAATDASTDAATDAAQTPATAQATGSATGTQVGEGVAVAPAAVNAAVESTVAQDTVIEQAPTETQRARTRPDLPGIQPESGGDDEEEFLTETQAGTILTDFVDPLTGEPTDIDEDPGGADGDTGLPAFLR